jgi:hypothetical protein
MAAAEKGKTAIDVKTSVSTQYNIRQYPKIEFEGGEGFFPNVTEFKNMMTALGYKFVEKVLKEDCSVIKISWN